MENKKAIITCRVVACLGILVGLMIFIFGISVLLDSGSYYGMTVDSYKKYGADYYTDSYEAMATTAINTRGILELTNSVIMGIGYIMIFGGLALMLGFIIKFANSYSVVKKQYTVKNIQQDATESEKNNDAAIILEYLRKNVEKENMNKGE